MKKEPSRFTFICGKCGKEYIKQYINYIFINNIEISLCDKCNTKLFKISTKHMLRSEFDRKF